MSMSVIQLKPFYAGKTKLDAMKEEEEGKKIFAYGLGVKVAVSATKEGGKSLRRSL